MKISLTLTLWVLLFGSLAAQPAQDIWLLTLEDVQDQVKLHSPINISNNPGYDNQPGFFPDGTSILYSSIQKDGQMDVMRYDLASGAKTRLTYTDGSEFSPTVTPDGAYFSTIILEKDGTQLLQKYPLAGGEAQVIIPETVIGYHCWANDSIILAFVLGDPHTLQRCNVNTGTCTVADENIGRSLHQVPFNNAISYISKKDSANWQVKVIDPLEGEGRTMGPALNGTEDITWRGNGSLFKTEGTRVYRWRPGADADWVEVADLSIMGISGNLTRIAISPLGTHVAVVAAEPEK